MKRIRVTLAKRSQSGEELNKTIQVDWIVRSSPIAQKYFGCLKIAAAKNYMYRRDRFYADRRFKARIAST